MELIVPDWNAPNNVKAFSSTRMGGSSKGLYQGLNLGMHVEDDPILVMQNRSLLTKFAEMPNTAVWLNQTHSTNVIVVNKPTSKALDADGSATSSSGIVCAVMTADCLPVLLTDIDGTRVAAVHAGWRGLADGILENAVNQFDKPVLAWFGPAIGKSVFEVGQDVLDIFASHTVEAEKAFVSKGNGKYFADMCLLAKQRLNSAGIENITFSNQCTYNDTERFYSYRRDGLTGRQASFIWIDC